MRGGRFGQGCGHRGGRCGGHSCLSAGLRCVQDIASCYMRDKNVHIERGGGVCGVKQLIICDLIGKSVTADES